MVTITRTLTLLFIGVFLIAGCLTSDSGLDSDINVKILGRNKLEERLKDPDSLQIIEEKVIRPGKHGGEVGYYCKFRAKNSFGGYNTDEFYIE